MTTHRPGIRAKYPRSIVAGPYGHPFHPILITIPIGTWTASFVFDLIGFFAADAEPFTVGAQVLILVGILGAAVAGAVGFLDYSILDKGTAARATASVHMGLNLLVMGIFAVSLFLRWFSDHDTVNVTAFIVSLIGLGLLSISGYLGGKLAYHYGVRVAEEATQAEGFLRPAEQKAQEARPR